MMVFIRTILAGVCCFMLFPGHLFALSSNGAEAALATPDVRQAVAVAKFGGESSLSDVVTTIVSADLDRTSRFQVSKPGGESPDENQQIDYAAWKARGADILVLGSVRPTNDGRLETRFRLYDIAQGKEIGGLRLVAGVEALHAVAHRISDSIYKRLTGKQSALSSRLAYVAKRADRYFLMIADADGDYPQPAMSSPRLIRSLAWAPEGRRIALVSHEVVVPETGVSHFVVFLLSLASGKRQVAFNPPLGESIEGIAWSPDGTRIAVMSRTQDRSSLTLISVDDKEMMLVGISRSEDANPAFSADGQYIYFDSNRSGSRKIYRQSVQSGPPEPVLKEANESLAPRPSPDGKTLAYIARTGPQEHLALLDIVSGRSTILQESPATRRLSFASNSEQVLFSAKSEGISILKAVSLETYRSVSWTTVSEAANSSDFMLSPTPESTSH